MPRRCDHVRPKKSHDVGGSDWHGNNRVRNSAHNLFVSDEVLIELKTRAEKIRETVDIN